MRKPFFSAIFMVVMFGATSTGAGVDGPGMIIHFANVNPNARISIKNAILPSGADFPHAGSIGLSKNWKIDGKTMGAAPDGRELPEWVDFEWQEWPRPAPPMPRDPEALKLWNERVDSLAISLPRHMQRVLVRDRVPAEVVEELMQSKRAARRGELPDKWLWIHFVWTDEGIKLHWALEWRSPPRGVERVLSSGGDVIDKP